MTRCARCNGQVVLRDLDYGPCCLQCSRPLHAVVPAYTALEPRFDVDLNATITRERRTIVASAAAGKRDWS